MTTAVRTETIQPEQVDVSTALRSGMVALRQQQWSLASHLLSVALQQAPLSPGERIVALGAYASVLRRRGELNRARDAYIQLDELIGESRDARRAEALTGLADCYYAAGDAHLAERLATSALRLDPPEPLQTRARAQRARAHGRTDPMGALRAMRRVVGDAPDGSAKANALFDLAELELRCHGPERARLGYARALHAAQQAKALKSAADAMRRDALCRVLLDERAEIIDGLRVLEYAEMLALRSDDRSIAAVHAERGALLLHLASLPQARDAFRRGCWVARERNEILRNAHCLLGGAETARMAGTPDPKQLLEAEELYQRMDHAWGIAAVAVVRTLCQMGSKSEALAASAKPGITGFERTIFEKVLDRPDLPIALSFPD